MSVQYKEQTDEELVIDLHERKEFARLWVPPDDFRKEGSTHYEARTHQLFVSAFMNPNTPYMRAHLMHSTGCHARGTPILLADGSAIAVEELTTAHHVLGVDGRPRTIRALHRGRSHLWRIIPSATTNAVMRMQYVVDSAHILCVYNTVSKIYEELRTIDVVGSGQTAKHLHLYYRDGTTCAFDVDYAGFDRYYGFELEGNDGRFVGVDGLILHNSGKCLALGTLVRMYDGSTRAVEQIKRGQYVCGPSWEPRLVLGTTRGSGPCFIVRSDAHDPYVVNDAHILTVANESHDIIDIDVRVANEFLRLGRALYSVHSVRDAGQGSLQVGAPVKISAVGPREWAGFEVDSDGRFQLGDGTVTHNSRAALGVAQSCIAVYRHVYGTRGTDHAPSVYIVAFSGRRAFVDDLLDDPEFGYVSATERDEFRRARAERNVSTHASDRYTQMHAQLHMRLTMRQKGGFYKFLGYDELVNILFRGDASNVAHIIASSAENEDALAVVSAAIDAGTVRINTDFITRMRDCLIICDEIHNTYNSRALNSRGVALQYIMTKAQNVRLLTLSATPLNNSPGEIADFMNYFVEPRVLRSDLFDDGMLKPGAIEDIGTRMRGYVSAVHEIDLTHFPQVSYIGEPLTVRADEDGSLRVLPYLRFTPCPMSEYMMNTIRAFRDRPIDTDVGDVDEDDAIIGISQRYYTLFDMVYPNPTDDNIGLYDSTMMFSQLQGAPSSWRDAQGLTVNMDGDKRIISGAFLEASRLEKYSAKYAMLVREIGRAIRETGPCKIVAFHERVAIGVLLMREILRANGFLEYDISEPTDATRCAVCFEPRRDHHDASHHYRPLRFATVYSELDKHTLDTIITGFQSRANLHGEWCSILLGSPVIRESVNLPAVRHLFVLSLPVSIPQLVQVFGRCVRRRSHADLPPNERTVAIHILANVPPGENPTIVVDTDHAPEVRKYAIKLRSYSAIQDIERELARVAVDAGINRRLMTLDAHEGIGIKYFDEPVKFVLGDLRVDTFFAYGYARQEIDLAVSIMKRLFRARPTWKIDELRAATRKPPFGVNMNPALISDESMDVAIAFLASSERTSDARDISSGGLIRRVVFTGPYLTLVPLAITDVAGVRRSEPIIDAESYLRNPEDSSIWSEYSVPVDARELQTYFEDAIHKRLTEQYADASEIHELRQFLTEFSAEQQRNIAMRFVADVDFRKEFANLYAFMRSLGIFVDHAAVRKYRDMARFLREGLSADEPIVVCDGEILRIYDGNDWNEVARFALNMHTEYKEPGDYVGIYEQFSYNIKFKVRNSLSILRKHRETDRRRINRGMACMTKPRADVLQIARKVGVKNMRDLETVADICGEIQEVLLKLEIKARSDPHSHEKYVYGWWNAIPKI